ncbi:spore coat U domain-containing protein [Alkalilimnicola ehrlichii MLHE-1]|uniref:Spore coat U domain protein n=1 Tax=Alkalilimnicola ehrlichii (strain ATCC BAA-1101 / DSM 17681 / MLHE-1) TaxID=187272 RepID=Q0AAK6_ALKEH|nr:spore coat U domain-containing protein [Alkalilimnicola ehrlichii]ABI56131.1 Spore coat U domain protein [Alkalilimnicola ehrlichii MLHE-1]
MKRAIGLSLFLVAAGSGSAQAYTCSISADPLAFGQYDPITGAQVDGASEVSVSCSLLGLVSLLVSYEISLDPGTGGSYHPRALSSATDTLDYNLYVDTARTEIWGDGTDDTATVTDSYTLGVLTVTRYYPVYGRVFADQNVAAGVYDDTITATVEF